MAIMYLETLNFSTTKEDYLMYRFLGFSNHISTKKYQSGLTLIELMVVLGILGVLFSLTTINLTRLIPKANVNATIDTLIADLKHQQQKSMLGETGIASGSAQPFGIHIDSNQYVLYGGITYSSGGASNSAILLPTTLQLSTTFPSGNILFNKGSGEINGLVSSSSAVTITDTVTNLQKVIQINRYGVVTSLN